MSKDNERLVAQIPADLKRKLEKHAEQERRSVAKQVRFILELWLEKQK